MYSARVKSINYERGVVLPQEHQECERAGHSSGAVFERMDADERVWMQMNAWWSHAARTTGWTALLSFEGGDEASIWLWTCSGRCRRCHSGGRLLSGVG
jgi:hypothetical protein